MCFGRPRKLLRIAGWNAFVWGMVWKRRGHTIGTRSRIHTPLVQDLSYHFDAGGNLIERRDELRGSVENFGYDSLNRLVRSEVVGGTPISVVYDALGNIRNKSDVGDFCTKANALMR